MICEFFLLFFFFLPCQHFLDEPAPPFKNDATFLLYTMKYAYMYNVPCIPSLYSFIRSHCDADFSKKKKNISLFLIPFTFDRDVYTIRDINNNMLFMFLTVILPVYVSAFESYSTMSTEMNFSVK